MGDIDPAKRCIGLCDPGVVQELHDRIDKLEAALRELVPIADRMDHDGNYAAEIERAEAVLNNQQSEAG